MVYICLSTVSVSEFYRQFCTMLGLDAGGRKTACLPDRRDMFKAIQDRVYYLLKENVKHFLWLLMKASTLILLSFAILRC